MKFNNEIIADLNLLETDLTEISPEQQTRIRNLVLQKMKTQATPIKRTIKYKKLLTSAAVCLLAFTLAGVLYQNGTFNMGSAGVDYAMPNDETPQIQEKSVAFDKAGVEDAKLDVESPLEMTQPAGDVDLESGASPDALQGELLQGDAGNNLPVATLSLDDTTVYNITSINTSEKDIVFQGTVHVDKDLGEKLLLSMDKNIILSNGDILPVLEYKTVFIDDTLTLTIVLPEKIKTKNITDVQIGEVMFAATSAIEE